MLYKRRSPDAQLPLNLLQRRALRLRNHRLHPDELQHHHAGKERENVAGRKAGDHLREESCEQGGEDPMREAAERLALRAMAIGKYLGDKTQITAPWPIGVRAMKAKMQTGTIENGR
jgi:hypothetical protein